MPIRRELRPLYPPNWPALSQRVRFERAGGLCQVCGRPHGERVRCLPDGRWFDQYRNTWRDRRGRPARWPDLVEAMGIRTTRVVLAAAHLDHDPANNRLRNLRSLCQRCHILHDRPHHLAQRWLTYRLRYALGDLFLGVYQRGFGSLHERLQRALTGGRKHHLPHHTVRSADRGFGDTEQDACLAAHLDGFLDQLLHHAPPSP
jgi:hypothetical protein